MTDVLGGSAYFLIGFGVLFFLIGLIMLALGSDHSLTTTTTVGWVLMVISGIAIIIGILIAIFHNPPREVSSASTQPTITQPLLAQQTPMYVLVQ